MIGGSYELSPTLIRVLVTVRTSASLPKPKEGALSKDALHGDQKLSKTSDERIESVKRVKGSSPGTVLAEHVVPYPSLFISSSLVPPSRSILVSVFIIAQA